mgnify:CR=1 FL=1|tara:strand:+ start:1109 stop:1819 length:711 start_codon:yes stop_codon:yes gene_type:complete
MVEINSVYQKVLTLSNKEQRGYITPQEFNHLADRAQLEIFEGYFHDLKTAFHKIQNQSEESDEVEMLQEKLSLHRVLDDAITVNNTTGVVDTASFANTPYRLTSMRLANQIVEEVTRAELALMRQHPLTTPTETRRIYYRTGENAFTIFPVPTADQDDTLVADYIVAPATPSWGYVVVQGNAIYNANTTVNFDLHPSEEEKLVTRILEMAGIVINKPGLAQTASQMIQREVQSENN